MGLSGRSRMIESVSRLTGEPCEEAVVIQERSRSTIGLAVAGGLAMAVILALIGLPAFLTGALIGGTVGLVFAGLTTYWILGRVPSGIVLVSSKKTHVSGIAVVDRYPAPVSVATTSSWLTDGVAFGGREFRLAKQFRARFAAIVGEPGR